MNTGEPLLLVGRRKMARKRKKPQKSRLLYLHREVNPGKVEKLEALHAEYVAYVRLCVQEMLKNRRYSLEKWDKQSFFPRSEKLTSQIEKNARDHAIAIVSAWAASVYARIIKKKITRLRRAKQITKEQAHALYTIGKHLIGTPWEFITQLHIDFYHYLLDKYGGNTPTVRDTIPMRLSEMTARLEDTDGAIHADFWLRVSSLEFRKSIWLPLVGNPYVKRANQVSKGISARKTKKGKWRFEVVEKKKPKLPKKPRKPTLKAIDVGLNVLATDSDGNLYGEHFKSKFDYRYNQIRTLRANRQRQGLRENSPRLNKLESRLTGMIKTECGRITNRLVKNNPGVVWAVEDLDLSGCKGQKRFAYRALQSSLESKAYVMKVNPAYTSQECPSCGYIHRGNRHGTKFVCRSCGRKAHADWVGAGNILRRSEDKNVTCDDLPADVEQLLKKRYQTRRNPERDSLPGAVKTGAFLPLSPSLTTGGPPSGRHRYRSKPDQPPEIS